jgi:small subunit ribosomal protein S5
MKKNNQTTEKISEEKEEKEEKKEEETEFEQQLVDLARVTRVVAGGKRLRFRACMVVGNRKGKVGEGVAKGLDVAAAIEKAVKKAKKNLITVPIINETIPHEVLEKYGAALVLLKPARPGRGIIAGGPVRVVLELAGIPNVTSKILGSKNKINNVRATINALRKLKTQSSKLKTTT